MNISGFLTRFAQPIKAAALVTTAVAMPAILAGCSSSNTAPFQAPVAGPTDITIAVAPASLDAVGETATFTFTLDNATPDALDIPFTTALATASTTTFDPALPAEGTVTIPAGQTTATLTATVATLPANDTTTTVTLTTTALGGATASFTVVGPVTPPPVTTVDVAPAAPAKAVASGYRLLVGIASDADPALGGTLTAGGATFVPSGVQAVTGKTVFVPNAGSAFSAIAQFTEIDFENLTGGPAGTDFTTVCFEVEDLEADPVAVVSDSAACP